VRQFLLENPDAADDIDARLREILLPKDEPRGEDDAPAEAAVGES